MFRLGFNFIISHRVNLKDENRIRTLIRQNAQDLANSVSFKGHVFAMKSASQHVSPSGGYDESLSGEVGGGRDRAEHLAAKDCLEMCPQLSRSI